MLTGIIPVYKEKGYTSFDVVAKLRGITKQKKIGHTGTLDPDATGVLPVCLGKATKLVDLITDSPKEYIATILFGLTTDTQDTSGKILKKEKAHLQEEEIIKVLKSFEGEYLQVPPMYSALKHNGRKLYELARKGKVVERKARPVTIYSIDTNLDDKDLKSLEPLVEQEFTSKEVLGFEGQTFSFKVTCSKGTYIRTLIDDCGKKLGCGATMAALTRSKAGNFDLSQALKLEELEKLFREDKLSGFIKSPEEVFIDCPLVTVKEYFDYLLANGNKLWPNMFEQEIDADQIRVEDSANNFAAIYIKDEDFYRVKYNFI